MQYFIRRIKYFFMLCCQKLFCDTHRSGVNKQGKEVVEDISSILVIRLDEIGDMVMLSPFLHELRRWKPKARITLVVKPQVRELFTVCPYIDELKIFTRYTGRADFLLNMWKAYIFCKNNLQGVYDLALVPRWDSDYGYWAGYVAAFSNSYRRVAYSCCVNIKKSLYDAGFDGFYTDIIRETSHVHEVERSLDILRYLGACVQESSLEVWYRKEAGYQLDWLEQTSKRQGVIRIAVFLSSGMQKKEWDVSKYVEVVNKLVKRYTLEIVLGGAGKRAKEYAVQFKECCPYVVDLVDKTTLTETIQLIKSCDCYLGGDTGPMHIAAACGLLGVALYVDILDISEGEDNLNPERFGPWMSDIVTIQPDKMLAGCEHGCRKNYAHCINTIEVDDVYEKMCKVLDRIQV